MIFEHFTLFEVSLFLLNIFLFFTSKTLFNYFYKDNLDNAKPRIKFAFVLTGALLILQSFHFIFHIYNFNFDNLILKFVYTLSVFYFILIIHALFHFFLKNKFGTDLTIDGKKVATDTHVSRMFSMILSFFSIFLTVYLNIQIWSAASLMETTGIVGLTLGALALTNSVWFPDIYRGLIALKVKSFEVGDVIKLDNREDEYIVYNASISNLTLLNIRDNHRMFLWNNQLSSTGIHNLSKVAGSLGLRKTFVYKVGYPSIIKEPKKDKNDKNENQLSIEDLIEKIRKIAYDTFKKSIEQNLHIKEEEFNIRILNTGDNAIEFVLSFYLDKLPKTIVTRHIREYLIDTPLQVNELFLINSYKYGIDLSTPTLYKKV